MPTYKATVCRISVDHCQIEITADDEAAARDLAIKLSRKGQTWTGDHDYEVESIAQVKGVIRRYRHITGFCNGEQYVEIREDGSYWIKLADGSEYKPVGQRSQETCDAIVAKGDWTVEEVTI